MVSITKHSLPFPFYPVLVIWYLPTELRDDDAAATRSPTSTPAPKPTNALLMSIFAFIICEMFGRLLICGSVSLHFNMAIEFRQSAIAKVSDKVGAWHSHHPTLSPPLSRSLCRSPVQFLLSHQPHLVFVRNAAQRPLRDHASRTDEDMVFMTPLSHDKVCRADLGIASTPVECDSPGVLYVDH